MELYFNSKTQHTTVKHSQQLYEHNMHMSFTVSHTRLTTQLKWSPKTTKTCYYGSQLQFNILLHDTGK
jgi:hypothetical protein